MRNKIKPLISGSLDNVISLFEKGDLMDSVHDRLGLGHDWDTAVALGRMYRLADNCPTLRDEYFNIAMSGADTPDTVALREIIKSIPEEHIRFLAEFSNIRAFMMVDTALSIGWLDQFVLVDRDDLDSVRLVAKVAGNEEAVKAIDAEASFVDSNLSDMTSDVPEFEFDNPVLHKAACIRPDAWWANVEPLV